MKRSRKHRYLMLIVLLLSVGVGYAFLTTDLKINGTVNINDSNWNVHFANYQRTNNSTITPTSGNEPVIVGDNTREISYTVGFNEPGEVYEFTVDIVNGGTMDATIVSLNTTVKEGSETLQTIPNVIKYSMKYNNGNEYVAPHVLVSGASEKILVRVEFKKNISVSQYEEIVGKDFQITTKIVSRQGDGSEPFTNYLYSSDSGIYFYIGQEVPEEAYVYDNYQDVESDVFLRHTMNENTITKTDIGYIKDGTVYYISTFEPDNEDQFDKTSSELMKIIDDPHCNLEPGSRIMCPGVASAYLYDNLIVSGSGHVCEASDLFSFCHTS